MSENLRCTVTYCPDILWYYHIYLNHYSGTLNPINSLPVLIHWTSFGARRNLSSAKRWSPLTMTFGNLSENHACLIVLVKLSTSMSLYDLKVTEWCHICVMTPTKWIHIPTTIVEQPLALVEKCVTPCVHWHFCSLICFIYIYIHIIYRHMLLHDGIRYSLWVHVTGADQCTYSRQICWSMVCFGHPWHSVTKNRKHPHKHSKFTTFYIYIFNMINSFDTLPHAGVAFVYRPLCVMHINGHQRS